MRTLLIEDNHEIAECMVKSLTAMDIAGDHFDNGRMGIEAAKMAEYDLLVLDLNLPDMDGLTILQQFKLHNPEVPVLIVSARIDIEDRVKGLDLGADDYLIKPFVLEEWEARVRVLLRRGQKSLTPLLSYGTLEFEQTSRMFSLGGDVMELSPRERAVLETLIRKNGAVISKEKIAEHIFTFDDEAAVSSIEIYIHRLRKKLAKSDVSIVTHRGLGYSLG